MNIELFESFVLGIVGIFLLSKFLSFILTPFEYKNKKELTKENEGK